MELDAPVTDAKTFYRGFIFDECHDDLARGSGRLSPYNDDIARIDTGPGHAFAVHAQGEEIVRDMSRFDRDIAFQILHCSAKCSRLNSAENGDELRRWKLRQGKPTRFTRALRQSPLTYECFQMPPSRLDRPERERTLDVPDRRRPAFEKPLPYIVIDAFTCLSRRRLRHEETIADICLVCQDVS